MFSAKRFACTKTTAAGEGSNLRETGQVLNYPGQVLTEEQEIFSSGQNIAQNCTTMRVVVIMQY